MCNYVAHNLFLSTSFFYILSTNSDVSMWTHISRTVSNCFSGLWQLRSIQRSISQPVLLSLVMSQYWHESTMAAQHCLVFLATC